MKRRPDATFLAAAGLLLALAAGPTAAGDEPPPAPAAEKPHPLADVLRDVQRAAHLAAWNRVRTISVMEAHLQATARIDADQDGTGEHGGLRDLTESLVSDSKDGPAHPALDPVFAQADDDGQVVVAGYVFRVFLPGKSGAGVHETSAARAAGVDADLAEQHWCLYAWPRTYGRSGRFTFFVQDGGTVLATDAPAYSGKGHGPAADAAMLADSEQAGLLGRSAAGRTARDGRVWREADSVRPDEITAAAIPQVDGPWRSAERVAALASAACDDVEKALGGPIPGGRPRVRIAGPGDVEAALRADLVPLFKRLGMPDQDVAGTLSFAGASLLAKYDHRAHEILVVPATAEISAELLHEPWLVGDAALRAVLVHEETHAHDFRSHALAAALDGITRREAFTAWSAVVEGHAQFVAEQVAKERGDTDSFDRLASSLAWTPKTDDPAMDAMFRTFSATLGFPYTAGLRFFTEVARQGGAAAVTKALDTPPQSAREIESPALWLAGGPAAQAVPTDALLDRFAKLAGEGWKSGRSPVLATAIRAQVESVGVTDDAHALDRATDLKGLFMQGPPGGGTVAILVMRTTDDAGAAAIEQLERRISEAKDRSGLPGGVRLASSEYTQGAGAEGKLPGFVAVKVLQSGTRTQTIVLHVARLPRCIVEITLMGASAVSRDAIDAALADAAKTLADGAATPGTK